MANPEIAEYWRGYRNAKIYAYLMFLERKDEVFTALDPQDQFTKGLMAGVEALQIELHSMLEKS